MRPTPQAFKRITGDEYALGQAKSRFAAHRFVVPAFGFPDDIARNIRQSSRRQLVEIKTVDESERYKGCNASTIAESQLHDLADLTHVFVDIIR
ncbi:hypothetical protein D3C76_1296420 [compost metagenome]